MLASTNTWNAYNNFGGRSSYINPEGLPARPVVNSRQDLDRFRDQKAVGVWRYKDEQFLPLSFDRPEPNYHILDDGEVTDPVRGRVQCGQAPGEWRLAGWRKPSMSAFPAARRDMRRTNAARPLRPKRFCWRRERMPTREARNWFIIRRRAAARYFQRDRSPGFRPCFPMRMSRGSPGTCWRASWKTESIERNAAAKKWRADRRNRQSGTKW